MRIKKPVGILHVNVVRAKKLLKMDLLGLSDPYAKLSLSGERLPAKKTTVKKKTLNPIWNENFKLAVRDPQSQYLLLDVFDWDKVYFTLLLITISWKTWTQITQLMNMMSTAESKMMNNSDILQLIVMQ